MSLKGFWFSIESTCSFLFLFAVASCFVWIGCSQGKTMRVTVFLFWGDISGETAPFKSAFFSDSRCSRIVHLFLASTNLITSRRGKISSYIYF